MATTINAGRVRFVSRGTYNNSTQYYLFDLVDYNGSSYIAKENTLGNLPTNTQYWQLIAEKGNTGSTGQTGPVGATGNGIASITKTGTSGLVDTYTITYTNGNTTTFTITNGEDGEVTETELDVLRQNDTELKNDISKIKEEQTTQNGNITKNADEITNLKNENAYLQNVVKQAFTETSANGTGLTIDNTIEARMEMKLNGNTRQNTTTGKNLFNKDTSNFINAFISGTGVIRNASTVKTYYIECLPNMTYTISKISGKYFRANTINTIPVNNSQCLQTTISQDVSSSITITTDANAKYLLLNVYDKSADTLSEQEILNSVQIEKGTTVTDYEPYTNGASPNPDYPQEIHCVKGNNVVKISNGTEETEYKLNLGNIELNAIEDFKDCLKKEKNKWYKVENIGSYTFKGNEDFHFAEVGTINQRFDIQTSALNISSQQESKYKLFTHFRRAPSNSGIWGEYYMSSDWIVIKNNDNIMTSLEDFKAWLSANKPTIYYARTSSVNKEITDTTLITQLDEISQALSKKGTTIISQNNDDLPFNLDVIALTK